MLPVGCRAKRLHLPLSRFFISSRQGEKIKMIWTGLSSFLCVHWKGNCGAMRLDQEGKAKEVSGDHGYFASGSAHFNVEQKLCSLFWEQSAVGAGTIIPPYCCEASWSDRYNFKIVSQRCLLKNFVCEISHFNRDSHFHISEFRHTQQALFVWENVPCQPNTTG